MRKLFSRLLSRARSATNPAEDSAPAQDSQSASSQQEHEPNDSRTNRDSRESSSSGTSSRSRKRRSRGGSGNRAGNAHHNRDEDQQADAGGQSRSRGGRGRNRNRNDNRDNNDSRERDDSRKRSARGAGHGARRPAIDDNPTVIKEKDHDISARRVSRAARSIVEDLRSAGYSAELVGGCVRDLLLGLSPKDFDIATDARPEEVQNIFRRARLVGRRFRLAHVRMGREVFEVATYRAAPGAGSDDPNHALTDDGRLISDNVYGNRQQDALRRDFTVNALYYDPLTGEVLDYTGGVDDLDARVMRMIGDPDTRLREDPVRMLRAIRFGARLDLDIEEQCAAAIPELAYLLGDVPPARLFDETLKLFHYGNAGDTWQMLRDYGVAEQLFGETVELIEDGDEVTESLIEHAFENTDRRVREDKPVIAPFLFAAALWGPMRQREAENLNSGMDPRSAFFTAADDTIAEQCRRIAIPRRASVPMREIWSFQSRLEHGRGKRTSRFVEHKRFRAAYDFLLLRASAGDVDESLAEWWTEFIDASDDDRRDMVKAVSQLETGDVHDSESGEPKKKKRRRRRRKRGGQNRAAAGNAGE